MLFINAIYWCSLFYMHMLWYMSISINNFQNFLNALDCRDPHQISQIAEQPPVLLSSRILWLPIRSEGFSRVYLRWIKGKLFHPRRKTRNFPTRWRMTRLCRELEAGNKGNFEYWLHFDIPHTYIIRQLQNVEFLVNYTLISFTFVDVFFMLDIRHAALYFNIFVLILVFTRFSLFPSLSVASVPLPPPVPPGTAASGYSGDVQWHSREGWKWCSS